MSQYREDNKNIDSEMKMKEMHEMWKMWKSFWETPSDNNDDENILGCDTDISNNNDNNNHNNHNNNVDSIRKDNYRHKEYNNYNDFNEFNVKDYDEQYIRNVLRDEVGDNKYSNKKIFVGNVPFNCSQEEFEKCFDSVQGVIKAEIVKGVRDDSRGIGFITMNSERDAELLKNREDIKCKGRTLRFYPYQTHSIKNKSEPNNNYVYIEGVPIDKDRTWLKEVFKDYGPFNRYFIYVNQDTGERKTSALLDLADDKKYDKIIGIKTHYVKDPVGNFGEQIVLTAVRYKQKNTLKYKPRKNAKKEQLLSAMIIEENKESARERSGKRFHK